MASFLELFADLAAPNANSAAPLDPDVLGGALDKLRGVREKSDEDDDRIGKPEGDVKVVGDPEIVDSKGRYFHYLGPALLVNIDGRGMLRSLEFVGVEGGMKDANYIRDVWQYDVRTQKYKYQDLKNMQGVPAHRVRCRDQAPSAAAYYGDSWTSQGDAEFFSGREWSSECEEGAVPALEFLRKFKPTSETFFINVRTNTFVRGPQYSMLKAVIENPARFVKPLVQAMSCSKPPDLWMEQAAHAITTNHDRLLASSDAKAVKKVEKGKPPLPNSQEQAAQVAQLVFGLTACVAV